MNCQSPSELEWYLCIATDDVLFPIEILDLIPSIFTKGKLLVRETICHECDRFFVERCHGCHVTIDQSSFLVVDCDHNSGSLLESQDLRSDGILDIELISDDTKICELGFLDKSDALIVEAVDHFIIWPKMYSVSMSVPLLKLVESGEISVTNSIE